MYRLRLFYVARVFLRAFGRRGEGAAPLLYRKGSNARRANVRVRC
jgi:hypothetical protein